VLAQRKGASMPEPRLSRSFMPTVITSILARSRFLRRPQLLTRVEPLPIGRDIPRSILASSTTYQRLGTKFPLE